MTFRLKNDMAKQGFSDRLNQALAAKKVPERARTGILAKLTGTSREAARKWQQGMAIPGKANIKILAGYLNVREEWLEYGTPPIRAVESDDPEVEEALAAFRELLRGEDEARRRRLIDALRLLTE